MFSVLLAVALTVCFLGCDKDTTLYGTAEFGQTLACVSCGHMNSYDHNYCSACGYKMKASTGTSEDHSDEVPGEPEDVNKHYTLLEYLKKTSDKQLIIYECDGIGKDEEIRIAYVISNGQCRKYYCSTTLGELSKMTDEQILEMLEMYYQNGLAEALSIWKSEPNTENAISKGMVKLYEPRSYDIAGCLFTDSTGNAVVGELLFFPVAGVSSDPYIIQYPQHSDPEERFMNYYGTYKDSSSLWDIKFNVEYFNTGNGTRSDVNQINDLYYITNSSMTTGTVYDSTYYGLMSKSGAWSNNKRTLCFRIKDLTSFSLGLDAMSSSEISFVDPDENDILQITNAYYNAYYSSFKTLE